MTLWVIERRHRDSRKWEPTAYVRPTRAQANRCRRVAFPPNDDVVRYRVVKYLREEKS